MAEECEDECGCGEPTLSVSRAKYTSFVVTGPTIFGKANALAPVRTEKVCCDFFFGICLLTVSVFWIQQFFEGFSVQQSLQFFRRHDLGNLQQLCWNLFEALSQGGLFEKRDEPSYGRSMGESDFPKPWIWMCRN